MNSKIKGNTLGILRRSFFPFNALGMPSFNNSVLSEYLCILQDQWKVCASQCADFIVLVTPSLLSLLLNQPSDEFETIQVTGYLFLPFPITMGI